MHLCTYIIKFTFNNNFHAIYYFFIPNYSIIFLKYFRIVFNKLLFLIYLLLFNIIIIIDVTIIFIYNEFINIILLYNSDLKIYMI